MSRYRYADTYDTEQRIGYLKDFATWLKRESSLPECNRIASSQYRSKQRPDLVKALGGCPKISDYWNEYKRERALEHKPVHARKCDREALAHTQAFIQHFASKGRGAQGFCDAAAEYLERPKWSSEDCQKLLQAEKKGRSITPQEIQDIYGTETGKGYQDICPYIEGAVERAANWQRKLTSIEGQVAATHPRNRWLMESQKRYPHYFGGEEEIPPPPETFVAPELLGTEGKSYQPSRQRGTFVAPELLQPNPYQNMRPSEATKFYFSQLRKLRGPQKERQLELFAQAFPTVAADLGLLSHAPF